MRPNLATAATLFRALACAGLLALPAQGAAAERSPAVIFRQSAVAVDAAGRTLPQLRIEPEKNPGLWTLTADFGCGRVLEIRTDLPPERRAELDEVAAVIQRCYVHLENATGRRVPGGVLLYVLAFDEVPLSYAFETALADRTRWSQVRLALVSRTDALTGPGAAPHLEEMLYDTLPHELTHNLIDCVPTVAHEVDGAQSPHTRWFLDGVCEHLAKEFSRGENPAAWRRLLADRGLDGITAAGSRDWARLLDQLFVWEQQGGLDWQLESDLYGVAMLVAGLWLAERPLPELLAGLAAAGGGADGRTLRTLLAADLDLTPARVARRAGTVVAAEVIGSPLSAK